ncbi:MAG: 50S ribosomal protein L18 [Candidatus Colwellbacteria bacterium RIFCSPLOWO2_01_FULL_48_10]|uniref:Large ribosomal subunit protein uL18 n=1 Tax=Candidatus Colwellbacteria bacterium RIFCSPLOWO2_01_FULL_48_10 TaxID=1797690 RepID=A0A1G1Z6A6_9BACT|nr:MAG: 50S ribosomal protein L18 [Candidatus Colwellbacteria bacterium RIFCSPLOWO2_01_FULL_48_10]
MNKKHNEIKRRRAIRNRAKITGIASSPRLSVFRSNTGLYAQLIDDESGKTVVSFSTRKLAIAKGEKVNKTKQAEMLGKQIAEMAKKAGITKAIMDRGSYRYHGRVKALADGARAGGLKI